jgi:hypothetical protein
MEFIEHGLHYVFPQQSGTLVTGIPTAHSYGLFNEKFQSDEQFNLKLDTSYPCISI